MSLLSPTRAELLLWLAICGGLAIVIGQETDWGTRWQSTIPTHRREPASFSKPTLSEPFKLPPADEYLETSMRPLFVATRRPTPQLPPPEAPKPAMKRDQFSLTGITMLPEGKFAFLIEKTGNKSRVVSEGKEINGILVKEISNDRVVLTQYEETEVLLLKTAKGPAATIVPGEKDGAATGAMDSNAAEKPSISKTAPPPPAVSGTEAARSAGRTVRQASRATVLPPTPEQPLQQGAAPK